MGRKSKIQSRRNVKRNVGKRRATGVAPFPRALPFAKLYMNTVVRIAVSEKTDINVILGRTYTPADCFPGMWKGVATTFSEVRVKRVSIWVIPSAPTSATGLLCLVVAPSDELRVDPSKPPKFMTLGGAPGAIVRKCFQPAHSTWFPTSPSERGWFSTSSTEKLFTTVFGTTGMTPGNGVASSTYMYELVMDFHVSVRGLNSSYTAEDFPQQLRHIASFPEPTPVYHQLTLEDLELGC